MCINCRAIIVNDEQAFVAEGLIIISIMRVMLQLCCNINRALRKEKAREECLLIKRRAYFTMTRIRWKLPFLNINRGIS